MRSIIVFPLLFEARVWVGVGVGVGVGVCIKLMECGVTVAAFFSVLVFVCSFIPLLGVLLSTMPMGHCFCVLSVCFFCIFFFCQTLSLSVRLAAHAHTHTHTHTCVRLCAHDTLTS